MKTARVPERLSEIYDRCTIEDGHRIWPGGMHGTCPQMYVGDQKHVAVRHLVLRLRGKPHPKGNFAVVTCGNRRCLTHLQSMTKVEYFAMHVALGTMRTYKNAMSKTLAARKRPGNVMTMERARVIRARHAAGERVCDIGASLGLSVSRVCAITKNRSWRETGVSVFNPASSLASHQKAQNDEKGNAGKRRLDREGDEASEDRQAA